MSRAAPWVALVLLLHGCVVPAGHAPDAGYVPDEALRQLRREASSRSEVLMTLGVPDHRFCGDRAFRYTWKETVAILFFPAGYQAGGFSLEEKKNLLIDFEPDGATRRVDVIAAMSMRGLNDKEQEWLRGIEGCMP